MSTLILQGLGGGGLITEGYGVEGAAGGATGMPKFESNVRSQLGYEAGVFGTAVPAVKRLPNMRLVMHDELATTESRGQGFKYASSYNPNKEHGQFTYEGDPSYDELQYILCSLLADTTPTSLGSGAYQWRPPHTYSGIDVPATYTLEHGDDSGGWRLPYGLVTDMTLALSRDEVKVSGSGFGQLFATGATMTGNDVQTLTITGSPTGGTFTLTSTATGASGTTATIPWNATVTQVQAALNGITGMTGNVVVAGTAMPGGSMTISFKNVLGNQLIPLMTGSAVSLTGGTSPAVVVAHTQSGAVVTILPDQPILPTQVDVYLASSIGGLAAGQLLGDYSIELGIGGRWGPRWPLKSSNGSHGGHVELIPTNSIKLKIDSDGVSDALLTQFRAAQTKYLEVKATGPVIGGGIHYSLDIIMPFQVKKGSDLSADAGVWVADWEVGLVADPTAGYPLQATLVNASSAL